MKYVLVSEKKKSSLKLLHSVHCCPSFQSSITLIKAVWHLLVCLKAHKCLLKCNRRTLLVVEGVFLKMVYIEKAKCSVFCSLNVSRGSFFKKWNWLALVSVYFENTSFNFQWSSGEDWNRLVPVPALGYHRAFNGSSASIIKCWTQRNW